MRYNLKLINDYINGEDLEGHTAEELEDNPKFMEQVILATNDKNMYNLCSNKVKSDYDFVMFLIDKFYYDPMFIDEVASFFLENNHYEPERAGILVLMCNKLDELHEMDLFAKYRLIFIGKFLTDMVEIESYKQRHPNDERELGLGFIILYDSYSFDSNIIKYFAKQLIEYLFTDYGVDLESEIHKSFRTPNDIYKSGLMNYMIGFLGKYDAMLSDYASAHTDVLDGFQERINKIQVKWNKYTDKEEQQKYEEMFDRVHEYISEHELETVIGEFGYLYFIGKELGISGKLATYSGLDRATYEELNKEYNDDEIKTLLSDLQERIIYANVKRIMLETLFGEYEQKNNEGKIIEVDFSQGRK